MGCSGRCARAACWLAGASSSAGRAARAAGAPAACKQTRRAAAVGGASPWEPCRFCGSVLGGQGSSRREVVAGRWARGTSVLSRPTANTAPQQAQHWARPGAPGDPTSDPGLLAADNARCAVGCSPLGGPPGCRASRRRRGDPPWRRAEAHRRGGPSAAPLPRSRRHSKAVSALTPSVQHLKCYFSGTHGPDDRCRPAPSRHARAASGAPSLHEQPAALPSLPGGVRLAGAQRF